MSLVLMNVIDLLYTSNALWIGGQEANPLMRWVYNHHGMAGIAVYKLSALCLLSFIVPFLPQYPRMRILFYLSVLVYTLLTIYHATWYSLV